MEQINADAIAALRDFLWAHDRGYIAINRPDSAFINALREVCAKAE
jgi:hypothetical protein